MFLDSTGTFFPHQSKMDKKNFIGFLLGSSMVFLVKVSNLNVIASLNYYSEIN